jgi:calpain-5
MPWEAFTKYFTDISVCQLFNTSALPSAPSYNEYMFFERWSTNGVKSGAPHDRAGGCQNFSATFCFNPQYRFDVPNADSEVMIALTQKDNQPGTSKVRGPFVTIGLHVMKVESNRRHRIHQPINPVATSDYASTRSVYLHLRHMPVGRYIVMPTTYAPREEAHFMLRLYSTEDIDAKPLVRDGPKRNPFICSNLSSVTRIRIVDLYLSSCSKDSNIYCTIASNREKARTKSVAAQPNFHFDELFVFHSTALQRKYSFEIWEERALMDRSVARVSVRTVTDNDTVMCQLELASNCDNRKMMAGRLAVEISSYDDPMYL